MLLWFRHDLRTHDNPALDFFVAQRHDTNMAKALFFVTEKQWQSYHWSAIKIDFILRHVALLQRQLQPHHIELMIVAVDDYAQQLDWLVDYCRQRGIKQVIANAEPELNEVERDKALQARGVELTLFEADVIVPKGSIVNQTGQMYKVFTPFKKAWLAYVKQQGLTYLGKLPQLNSSASPVQPTPALLQGDNSSDAWPLADKVEQQLLPEFLHKQLEYYCSKRDLPAINGTSTLSPYLAIGAISPRYLLWLLLHRYPDLLIDSESSAFCWLNELIWREFYRHLIFHHPRLCRSQVFNQQYRATRWSNNPHYFSAWCQGRTGYPLVDAAMRQLKQTGWMHNRLRMVVASFLTKHLLIDWRWGEKYFMQQLIDGDLAANNGGWQWAAGTGCDAQPYFRIFNPIRQSERFDPDGEFIRNYLPELKDLPNNAIHFPHAYLAKQQLNRYWPAIVEHKAARAQALAFYKAQINR